MNLWQKLHLFSYLLKKTKKTTKKQMFLDITYKENAEEGVLTSSFLCVSFSAGRPGMRDRNSSWELCGSHWTLM